LKIFAFGHNNWVVVGSVMTVNNFWVKMNVGSDVWVRKLDNELLFQQYR
jgi:hypothetical protein